MGSISVANPYPNPNPNPMYGTHQSLALVQHLLVSVRQRRLRLLRAPPVLLRLRVQDGVGAKLVGQLMDRPLRMGHGLVPRLLRIHVCIAAVSPTTAKSFSTSL